MVVESVDDLYPKCNPGDVIQLVNRASNDVYHSVIVTKKDGTTLYYCGHSRAREDADVEDRFDDSQDYFIVFSFIPNTTSGIGSIDECGQCGDIPLNYYTRFSSATLSRVIECPIHETHDAEIYQYCYDAYCSIHDNYVGSIYEDVYVCLDE